MPVNPSIVSQLFPGLNANEVKMLYQFPNHRRTGNWSSFLYFAPISNPDEDYFKFGFTVHNRGLQRKLSTFENTSTAMSIRFYKTTTEAKSNMGMIGSQDLGDRRLFRLSAMLSPNDKLDVRNCKQLIKDARVVIVHCVIIKPFFTRPEQRPQYGQMMHSLEDQSNHPTMMNMHQSHQTHQARPTRQALATHPPHQTHNGQYHPHTQQGGQKQMGHGMNRSAHSSHTSLPTHPSHPSHPSRQQHPPHVQMSVQGVQQQVQQQVPQQVPVQRVPVQGVQVQNGQQVPPVQHGQMQPFGMQFTNGTGGHGSHGGAPRQSILHSATFNQQGQGSQRPPQHGQHGTQHPPQHQQQHGQYVVSPQSRQTFDPTITATYDDQGANYSMNYNAHISH